MRTSVRRTTASSQTTSGMWTRTTTCSSPSTTPMTMLTSTIAWCAPCVERARRAHCSTPGDDTAHLIGSSPEQTLCHPRSNPWCVLFDSISPFFFYFSFLSFSVYFLHNELFLELDNPIVMASLRYSAAEKSEGTSNASHSITGYEPNYMAFSELNDSSVPFSFMIPSSDQDVDDVTLGKLLTEAHRGQADYCEPEGMSVSQSSSSVMFDGSGQPDGERNVDHSVNFGVTRFFWRHPNCKNGRSIRATWWAKQLERTD